MGEKVANTLRTIPDSQKCAETLLGSEMGKGAAEHEFEMRVPLERQPPSESEEEYEQRA